MFLGLGSVKVFIQQSNIRTSRYLDQRLRSSRPRRVLVRGEQRLGPADGHVRAAARGVILKHETFHNKTSNIHTNRRRCLLHTGVKDVRAVGQLGGGETM